MKDGRRSDAGTGDVAHSGVRSACFLVCPALLRPAPDEREGYVPNVVYSCGAMIHGPNLILPYARSDTSSRIAIIPLADVLEGLTGRTG